MKYELQREAVKRLHELSHVLCPYLIRWLNKKTTEVVGGGTNGRESRQKAAPKIDAMLLTVFTFCVLFRIPLVNKSTE